MQQNNEDADYTYEEFAFEFFPNLSQDEIEEVWDKFY